MRKVISFVCSFILALILLPISAVASTQDTTSPVIESVEMVTNNAKPKDRIQFKVKVTDDISGVSSIEASFTSPTKKHSVSGYVNVAKATENNTYIITTNAINEFAEEGTWYITYLSVRDHSGNSTSKYYGYEYHYEETPPATFQVENKIADITSPIIESVEIITTNAKPKDRIQFKVKVTDDISGVSSIEASFTSPTKKHSVSGYVNVAKATENNTYIITTNAINEFAEEGTWYITYLSVRDHSRNSTSKYYGYEYHYEETPPVTFIVGKTSEVTPVDPDPVNPAPKPEDSDFQVWESKFNIDKNKKWTVTFALPFDPKTIYEGNIYVVDSKGTIMNTSFIIDSNFAPK